MRQLRQEMTGTAHLHAVKQTLTRGHTLLNMETPEMLVLGETVRRLQVALCCNSLGDLRRSSEELGHSQRSGAGRCCGASQRRHWETTCKQARF